MLLLTVLASRSLLTLVRDKSWDQVAIGVGKAMPAHAAVGTKEEEESKEIGISSIRLRHQRRRQRLARVWGQATRAATRRWTRRCRTAIEIYR